MNFARVLYNIGLFNDESFRCVLSAVATDHRTLLYRRNRWSWEKLTEPSKVWAQYLCDNEWQPAQYTNQLGAHRPSSSVFSTLKNRSYLLATICKSL